MTSYRKQSERTKERHLANTAECARDLLLILYEEGYNKLNDEERRAISTIRHACHEIAEGER